MTHFVERAKECGHVVAQCRCPAPEKEERYRAGWCAKCAYAISQETTRHHFPKSAANEEPPAIPVAALATMQQAELFE